MNKETIDEDFRIMSFWAFPVLFVLLWIVAICYGNMHPSPVSISDVYCDGSHTAKYYVRNNTDKSLIAYLLITMGMSGGSGRAGGANPQAITDYQYEVPLNPHEKKLCTQNILYLGACPGVYLVSVRE